MHRNFSGAAPKYLLMSLPITFPWQLPDHCVVTRALPPQIDTQTLRTVLHRASRFVLRPAGEAMLCALIGRGGEGRIAAPFASGLTLAAGRANNEDAVLIAHGYPEDPAQPPWRGYAVADGVGGGPAGEQASRLVLDCTGRAWMDGVLTIRSPEDLRTAAVDAAHAAAQLLCADPSPERWPATTVAGVVTQGRAWVGWHIGDSPYCVLPRIRSYQRDPARHAARILVSRPQTELTQMYSRGSEEIVWLEHRREERAHTLLSAVGWLWRMRPMLGQGQMSCGGGRIVLSTDGWLLGNVGSGDLMRMFASAAIDLWPQLVRGVLTTIDAMRAESPVTCRAANGHASTEAADADNIGVVAARIPSTHLLRRLAERAVARMRAHRPEAPAVRALWADVVRQLPQMHAERVVDMQYLLQARIPETEWEAYLRVMRFLR